LADDIATQAAFYDAELKPRLDAAQAGSGHVFFVDAAHFGGFAGSDPVNGLLSSNS
jgi:hypothetical protein